MRDQSVSKRGRFVVGRPDQHHAHSLINDRPTHAGFDVGDAVWRIDGLVCVGPVTNDASHAAALDVALRGADIVADVTTEREGAFRDDLVRAGCMLWTLPDNQFDDVTAALLESLVNGASVAQAARQCNLSARSAHRRLADARRKIGVTTNAQAITAWSSASTNTSAE